MLPVMIGTLVAVLEGLPVLPYVFWAAAGALVLAWTWTSFDLRRRIAEIRVDGQWVYVRSVADVLARRTGHGQNVIDVRDYGTWAHVTIGLTSYELDGARWPGFGALLDALYHAQSAWQEAP